MSTELNEEAFDRACNSFWDVMDDDRTSRDGVRAAIIAYLTADRNQSAQRAFNAGWNMAGGDHTQQEAFIQFMRNASPPNPSQGI